ncbi:MAG: heme-copper oxidase subunit III [Bryobacteraceae bacterium]
MGMLVESAWEESGGSGEPGASRGASFIGLFVLLAACIMVFGAFTGAFVFRRGLSDDWASMPKPPILFVNTAVLLASSFALEMARRALKAGIRAKFNSWWSAGAGLGVLFLLGQALAWRQLKDLGIYVATSPSSSFFYVLTASHAFHLVGGVAALIYVAVESLRWSQGPPRRTFIDISAIFWHFLDGLWVYLMVLFYVWG